MVEKTEKIQQERGSTSCETHKRC